jgi:hypothetical protein
MKKNCIQNFGGNEGKRPLRIYRHKELRNIDIELRETGCYLDRINLS